MIRAALAAAMLLAAPPAFAQAPAPTPVELTAPGPDRDGNNTLAVKGAPYRQLAEALGFVKR